ncbi:MAG: YidC/Oxa1 family membrane protein insertase, partial [Acetanaerobacterium sp.]
MNFIYSLFGYPLGWIMWLCYKVIPFYGIALILFTLITKLILLPFAVKQKKATAKTAIFQPKIAEIQKKFGKDKQKQQEAMMKLYEEEGYNPMSSCLPSLIQFPILFGLIDVVYKPMTHLLRLPTEIIDQIKTIGEALGIKTTLLSWQLNILGSFKADPAAFATVPSEYISQIQTLKLSFLGIDFTQVPKLALTLDGSFNWLIFLPIASGLAALTQTVYMSRVNRLTAQPAAGGSMKTMMYIMPVFSVFIAFSFPAGLSFYWTLSSLFSFGQEFF